MFETIKIVIMKNLFISFLNLFGLFSPQTEVNLEQTSIYDFEMKMLNGNSKSLSDYKGKVFLVVNVASKCGLTPQYKDIQKVYENYKDKGFCVLGFPANNFLRQEPGSDSEIKEFCTSNYGVTFDMFSKISVKGKKIHPLYQFLTSKKYNKIEDQGVKWNFQKFLFDKEGNMIKIIMPRTKITESDIINLIEAELEK